MSKYILLDYEGKWKNDVFRMFYYMANHLVSDLGYIMIDTTKYTTTNLITQQVFNNSKVLAIVIIENHDGKLLTDFFMEKLIKTFKEESNTRFYLLSDDIHKGKEKKLRTRYYEFFDKILVNYYEPFLEQYPQFRLSPYKDRVKWIPHCVPDRIQTTFNENPILQIGLFGNTTPRIYPNRAHLKNLSSDSNMKNKISENPHPAKKYGPVNYGNSKNLIGQNYFNTLSNYICNFSCSLDLGLHSM